MKHQQQDINRTKSMTHGLLVVISLGLSGTALATVEPTAPSPVVVIDRVTMAQTDAKSWNHVRFGTSFNSTPVVVMGPPSFIGEAPLSVRVRNISIDGFDYQLDEWDYLDGAHEAETISYLAVEPGTHQWGGLQVTAGSIQKLDHQWKKVNFGSRFDSQPLVFAQQISNNGESATTSRLTDIDSTGFRVKLQEEEALDGRHTPETVNYVAFAQGTGSVDAYHLSAGVSSEMVNEDWHSIEFGGSFDEPYFFAGMQTANGPDTATLRYQGLTAEHVQIKVEEEQSQDLETTHAAEQVGWLKVVSNAPVVQFQADADDIQPGESVKLSWLVPETNRAMLESVTITPDIGSVAATGERIVNPMESTNYVIEAIYIDKSGQELTISESVQINTSDVPVVANILPAKRPRVGRFTVGFRGDDQERGDKMAEAAAYFYTRNSRGKLNVVYTGAGRGNYVFNVDTSRTHNNVGGLSSYQHDVAIHELGHKLGFGHSKTIYLNTKGRFKGKPANDPSTVMMGTAVGAPFLIAPQYYLKDWLPEEEVALYDGSQTVYELKKISDFTGDGLSTVVITSAMWNKKNPGVGAPVFISFAHLKKGNGKEFAMHMLQDIATRLIVQSGQSHVDKVITGIGVEMLENADPSKITIAISLGHKD
jgi:hypothetical protein